MWSNILLSLEIYCEVCRWKKNENRLLFGKVRDKNKSGSIFPDTVYKKAVAQRVECTENTNSIGTDFGLGRASVISSRLKESLNLWKSSTSRYRHWPTFYIVDYFFAYIMYVTVIHSFSACTCHVVWLRSVSLYLWSPYVIGQTIIFLPCYFYLLSFFYSSPNLSGRRLDVYNTSAHGVALVRI